LVRLQGKGLGRRIAVVKAQGANVFRKAAALAAAAEQGNEPPLAGGSAFLLVVAQADPGRGALLGAELALPAPQLHATHLALGRVMRNHGVAPP
jgi:hypothetical protein